MKTLSKSFLSFIISFVCVSFGQIVRAETDGKIYLTSKDAELLSGSSKIYVIRGELASSLFPKGVEYKRDFAAIEAMAKKIIENGAAVFSSPLALSKLTLVFNGEERDNVECYRSGDFKRPKIPSAKPELSTSELCFIFPNLAE